MTELDWATHLHEQLDWHWQHALRPRFAGLSDEEYLWEPVPGCWSLRARADATTSDAAGGGDLVLDYSWPEPTPPPVTTIAWRLAHVTRGCLAFRTASHFGGPPAGPETWVYAATAEEALDAARHGVRRVGGRGDVARRRRGSHVRVAPPRARSRSIRSLISSSTSTAR